MQAKAKAILMWAIIDGVNLTFLNLNNRTIIIAIPKSPIKEV